LEVLDKNGIKTFITEMKNWVSNKLANKVDKPDNDSGSLMTGDELDQLEKAAKHINTNWTTEKPTHGITLEALGHAEDHAGLPKLTIDDGTISAGADLNDFVTPGTTYFCREDTVTSLVNRPTCDISGFRLLVCGNGISKGRLQLAIYNTATLEIWVRAKANDTWGTWGRLNVLTANDYGVELPANASIPGRIFYKIVQQS
jgi:hypothetical protein